MTSFETWSPSTPNSRPARQTGVGRVVEKQDQLLEPGRQVVGIHAVDLVWGLGTLHCMTWQQPA